MKRQLSCTDLALPHFFFFSFRVVFTGFLTARSKVKAYFHLITHENFHDEEDLLALLSIQHSGVTDGGPGMFQLTTAQMDCWGLCKSQAVPSQDSEKHWCTWDLTGVS